MANFFNRLFTKKETVQLTQHSTTVLKQIGDFFGFSYGQNGADQYIKSFGTNPLVYMIVNRIAFTSASINRVATDSNGKELKRSKILDILNNPNEAQGRIEFLETINQQLLITGNAYVRLIKGAGMGQELTVLNSNKVEIITDNEGAVSGYKYTTPANKRIKIDKEEVLHIRTSNIVNIENTDGYYGLSPLQAAWMVVKSSEQIFEAEASIFKNRGIVGILSNETEVPMLPKERADVQQEFNNEIGGADKFNSVKITNTKLKFVQTGMSPTDLKILDGILDKLRHLCAIYGLNSVLFNDQFSSTFNNVDAAAKDAYINTYIPLANKIDNELSAFLNKSLKLNEFIGLDTSTIEVLKGINKEHTEAILSQLEALVISKEEARRLLGHDVKNN